MQDQLATFLNFLQEERQYSNNTTAAYRNDLGQFVKYLRKEHNNITDLNFVTPEIVKDYVDNMKHKNYASSSVARKVAAIKSFFHHLFAKGEIAHDPTQDIDSPKVEKRLPITLSHEDVDKLMAAPSEKTTPKHLRDSALLVLLYSTGMRVTEAVTLQLSDLDLDENTLTCVGKNGENRVLPYDESTKEKIERYLGNGRPFLAKSPNEKALFLNHRGQQLTRQGLWLIIKAYAKNAKLSGEVTPHTLRHSFAAHKLNDGSDLQEVQQLLGHANISTTQIYNHLEDHASENGSGA